MSESTPKGHAMNTESAIAHLIADGMPSYIADAAWTVPEGMDCPWDSLAELLDHVELVDAEWVGGVGGLCLTFANPEGGGTITESFQPIL